jgi:ABC-type Fe3+/spermidine/putrescine transport system ATPase subunit
MQDAQIAELPEAKGVSLRSVTKKYGSFTAVQDLTLDIPAGSYCCLLGPSGCGKTTTMRMIAGHEDITAGDVLIGDVKVNGVAPYPAQHGHDVSKLCPVSPQDRLAKH